MQTIVTKYLPATNFKSSRVKAECERGSLTLSYPHELSGEDIHVWAANQLVDKFAAEDAKRYPDSSRTNPWLKKRACGQMKDHNYAHVFIG
jgi:hypothetical protein